MKRHIDDNSDSDYETSGNNDTAARRPNVHEKYNNFTLIVTRAASCFLDKPALGAGTPPPSRRLRWANYAPQVKGTFVRLHETVLSAASPVFEQLLAEHSQPSPILIQGDVEEGCLRAPVKFMYAGVMDVLESLLGPLSAAAQNYRIVDLVDAISLETEGLGSGLVPGQVGWNDVGFHGSNQIPTPNIDALAYNGIILNSHYVQALGTSSRTALLTGKYPMRLGMQGPSITAAEPRPSPDTKLLPEYFKGMGYSTHLIGKWHLGHSRWNDTPTSRGFDHFLGILNGYSNYYDYVSNWNINDVEYSGFDLRKDKEPAWDLAGKYATDLFTEHAVQTIESHDVSVPLFLMVSHLAVHVGNEGKWLEAPQETIDKFKHIRDPNRRTYAAMVSKLDDSVGQLMQALETKNILQNTIVVFISDNGAPTKGHSRNWGSNFPLRGVKDTLFEGGIRSVACIWSPLLVQPSRVSTDLMHVTDWLPTLYQAAGGDLGLIDPDLDGIDQWSSLVYDLPSARNDILLNIDEKTRNAGLRFYNWKLVVGTSQNGTYNGYFGKELNENIQDVIYNLSAISDSPAGKIAKKVNYAPISEVEFENLRQTATISCLSEKAKKNPCDPASGAVCLYDIPNDPCEENDLAKFFPSVVRRMKRALVEYRKGMVHQIESEVEIEKADPKLFGYTWNPWRDCSDSACTS